MRDLGWGMQVALRDRFSGTAKKIGRGAVDLSRNLKGLGHAGGQLFRGLSTIGKMTGVVGGLGVAYAGLVQPTKMVMDFHDNLASVHTLLQSMQWEPAKVKGTIDALIPSIRSMSREFGVETPMLINALWQSFSSGASDADEAIRMVSDSAKGLKAFGLDMNTGIALATDIIQNYGKEAGTTSDILGRLAVAQGYGKLSLQELGQYLRTVLPLGAKLGFTWEETASALAALTAGTGDAAASATKLKATFTTLMSIPGRPELLTRLSAMGMSLTSADMKAMGLLGTLEMLGQRTKATAPMNAGINLMDTLGLKFSAAELQGRGLAVAAATIATKMEEMGKRGQGAAVKAAMALMGVKGEMGLIMAMPIEKRAMTIVQALRQTELPFFSDAESMALFAALSDRGSDQNKIAKTIIEKMTESATLLDDAMETMLDTPGMKMAQMRAELSDLQLEIGNQLYPVIMEILNALKGVDWQAVGVWIRNQVGALESGGQRIMALVQDAKKEYSWLADKAKANPAFWSNPVNWGMQALGAGLGFDWENTVQNANESVDNFVKSNNQKFYETYGAMFQKLGEWSHNLVSLPAPVGGNQVPILPTSYKADTFSDLLVRPMVPLSSSINLPSGEQSLMAGGAYAAATKAFNATGDLLLSAAAWMRGEEERQSAVNRPRPFKVGSPEAAILKEMKKTGFGGNDREQQKWVREWRGKLQDQGLDKYEIEERMKFMIRYNPNQVVSPDSGPTTSVDMKPVGFQSAANKQAGTGQNGPPLLAQLAPKLDNAPVVGAVERLSRVLNAVANRPIVVQIDGKTVAEIVTRNQQWAEA